MGNQKAFIFRNTIYRLGIFIVVVTLLSISLLAGIGSNQSQVTIAQLQQQPQQQQQQMQANQTFTPSAEEQQQLLEGTSFQIDNVTFSHRMASVNGIQMHYVIG